MADEKINLDKPQFSQKTYAGRANHFLRLTNPLNAFASEKDLSEAKKVVDEFKKTKKMPEGYDADKLWKAKYLVDSAYHPDTGEKMLLLGRMSAQAPMNTLITGCMLTFYKTKAQTVFWQWVNQTFNALVNYTNRSGDAPIAAERLLTSYACACSGAMGTALYLSGKVKNMPPLFAAFVPFVAVCAANFINIPMMRSGELTNGTPVFHPETNERLGDSKIAARKGILLVCFSRCLMAIPGMTITPVVTNWATKRGWFCRYPMLVIPFQLMSVGICVTISTPLGCALFEQQASINVNAVEGNLQESIKKKFPKLETVTYNKGL